MLFPELGLSAYARTLFSLTWRIVLAFFVANAGLQIILNSFHDYTRHMPVAWRTTDAPLLDNGRKVWQKPHLANATGTPASYRPPGHDYEGGHRARATGDYEAWTPS